MKFRRLKKWIDTLSEEELDQEFKLCHVDNMKDDVIIQGIVKREAVDFRYGEYGTVHCVLCKFPREKIFPHHFIRIEEGELIDNRGRFRKSKTEKFFEVTVDGICVNRFDNYGDASDLVERLEGQLNR